MADRPAIVWRDRAGALLRLRLARPKANVLDGAMTAALEAGLAGHADDKDLKGALVDAEGPHFSYGASVEEHRPVRCAEMLRTMHSLVRRIAGFPVPVLFAVRGQCLGGALEIATAGHLVFAAPDAQFGQPEIKLGVFAPAASCILTERIGRMAAEDLLISGRSIPGETAREIGLVAAIEPDPEAAALAYFDRQIAPKSASSLRYAVAAVRGSFCRRLDDLLDRAERLYLARLMLTHDAAEGIDAFLAKRPARWENR